VTEKSPARSLLARHGITRTVTLRLAFVVTLIMIIGVRFERTIVALAISGVFLAVFFLLGRPRD